MSSSAPSVVFWQVIFVYNLYPIYFLQQLTIFIYIKSFFIKSSSNDTSVDIFDKEGSSENSPKAKFASPSTFTSTLEQTLKQNHRTSKNRCIVENMLNLLAFKLLLDQLLIETECSEVMLTRLFISGKCIRFF